MADFTELEDPGMVEPAGGALSPEDWARMSKELREGGGPSRPKPSELKGIPRPRPAAPLEGPEGSSRPPLAPPEETVAGPSGTPDLIQGPLAESGPGMAANRVNRAVRSLPGTIVGGIEHGVERIQDPKMMRETLRGAGAAAGGMAGFASPLPGGTVVGTVGGSMVGNYLADIYDSYKGVEPDKKMLDKHLEHLKDGLIDGAITGGTQVVLPVLLAPGKMLLARLLRLPPNSKELAAEAASIGVDIGPANIPGTLGEKAVNIFGRMPIIGGGAQKAAKTQARQIMAAHNDLYGQVANPRAMSEVGQEAYEAGTKKFAEIAVRAQQQAEFALRQGEAAGEILSATRLQTAAKAFVERMELAEGGAMSWMTNREMKFIKALANRPSNTMTVADNKEIDAFLEAVVRRNVNSTNTAIPYIREMRAINERALNASNDPSAKLMAKANADFKEAVRTLQTETAEMFGKTNRNVYILDDIKPGTVGSPEEMVEKMANIKSVSQLQDMRGMVGDDPIKQMARARLDIAWNKALASKEGEPFKFSAESFRESLGLGDPTSKAYGITKEMIRGTPVSIEGLEKLANVAESVANAPVSDVSTFMARAAMLRGAGSIADAFRGALTLGLAAGGTASAGFIPTLATMLMARAGVGSLMRPGLIEAATLSLDKTAGQAAKLAAINHLITTLPHETLEDILDAHIAPHVQEGYSRAPDPTSP